MSLPFEPSRSFELGRDIGSNVAGGFQQAGDTMAIDQILQQAQQSGDPAGAMQQILSRVSPQNREGAAQVLQARQQQQQQQQQGQALQQLGIAPGTPIELAKEQLKARATQQQQQQKAQPLLGGLDALNRQKELLKGGNLGPKVAFTGTSRKQGSTFSKEGIKDRAEFERLGKSLISLSSNIPIRNRLEFEKLAENLFDPTAKQETIQGSIEAMERIIGNNLQGFQGGQQAPQQAQAAPQQQPQQAQQPQQQFQVGQKFQQLPPQAPEGAVVRQGNKRFIFQNGQWSPL